MLLFLSYSVTEGLIVKKCISSFLSEYRCYPPPTQLHINQLLTLARHFLNRVINLSSLHLSPPFPLPFLFNLSSTFFYLFIIFMYSSYYRQSVWLNQKLAEILLMLVINLLAIIVLLPSFRWSLNGVVITGQSC